MNLVFDLDDTLYDLMGPFQEAYEKLWAGRTALDCEEFFKKSRVYSDVVLHKEKAGLIRPEDAFYERMRLTCEAAGFSISREEARQFEAEYRGGQKRIRLWDFIKDMLDVCKRENVPIAVLTNGSCKGQQIKMDALGLVNWFKEDHIFISERVGCHKPDLHAFQYVEKALGFQPEETWYIGDTYESDIVGASGAGWHTIWMNHRKRPCPEPVSRADAEITEKEQLLPLLREIGIL